VKEVSVEVLLQGWKFGLQWKKALALVAGKNTSLMSDIQVLKTDQGKYMGFIRMVAKKKS